MGSDKFADTKKAVYNKFMRAVNDHGMLDGARRVLLGLSGGADSTALLILFKSYAERNDIDICAVHVNHGIRGEEAVRDANFCRSLCQKYNIELITENLDIPALSRQRGKGLEETAREERYRIFEEAADKLCADRIATAHNADDNLETLLFNITRGSGIKGACGIPPVRGRLIRPLIYCTKSEITDFCKASGEDFVYDSSNSDTDYTRNFIRHEIIPKLKKINPLCEEAASRFCKSAKEASELISAEAEKHIHDTSVSLINSLPSAVKYEYFSLRFAKLSSKTLSEKHLTALDTLCAKAVPRSRTSLPGRIKAEIYDRQLIFAGDVRRSGICASYNIPITSGENAVPNTDSVIVMKNDDIITDTYKPFEHIFISPNGIHGRLYMRPRIAGDTVCANGMTKRLKKLFNEKHINPDLRSDIPVICDDDGIVWVPGVVCRDGVRVTAAENNILLLFGGI